MKAKDLKTGVVYMNNNGYRKGIIVTLDETFVRPTENMNVSQQVFVERLTGGNAGYLVLEVPLSYPDGQLIADAKRLEIPVVGEVWPYKILHCKPYRYRAYAAKDRHTYGGTGITGIVEEFSSSKKLTIPQANIWIARQFEGEMSTHAQRKADQAKLAQIVNDERIAKSEALRGQTQALVNRLNKLNLGPFIEPSSIYSGGRIAIDNETVKAMLNRLES